MTETTDQLGRTRSQTWTANSDVETTTDASSAGNVTTLTYDQLNNPTDITIPTGAATQAFYAAGPDCQNAQSGHPHLPKCTLDAQGNSRSMSYDAAGNPTTVSDTTPGGTSASFSYTYEDASGTLCGGEAGQVCSATDGNANTTSYGYTAGNLTSVTPPPPLGQTTYDYDAVGRLVEVTDGNGDTTAYEYDAADRVTRTSVNGVTATIRLYRDDGTVRYELDHASGASIDYGYNVLLGMPIWQHTNSPQDLGIETTINLTYDKNANLRTVTGAYASGPYEYRYDAANQLIEAGPQGSCPAGCVSFAYDDNGDETSRLFPGGGPQDTDRDASGRPTRITATDAGGAVRADVGYGYTQGGDDRTLVQTRTSHRERGVPHGAVTTYGYDSMNRLTQAEEMDGAAVNASWTYAYDDAGNRTSQTRTGDTGAPAGTITYTHNDANQITATSEDTTTWAYDGAGNQTRNGITGATATYGDRLQVTANGPTDYTTFGQGNTRQLTAGTTNYLHTDQGLVRETNGTDTDYIRDAGGDPINRHRLAPSYYVTDHLGSVLGSFNDNGTWQGGYSYSPYGERRSTGTALPITSNTLRFASGYEESPNLYKLGARYYDATLGRFTQADPTGQETHPYTYAAANPCNNTDPTGTATCAGAVFQAVLSAAGLAFATMSLVTLTAATGGWALVGILAGFEIAILSAPFSVRNLIESC